MALDGSHFQQVTCYIGNRFPIADTRIQDAFFRQQLIGDDADDAYLGAFSGNTEGERIQRHVDAPANAALIDIYLGPGSHGFSMFSDEFARGIDLDRLKILK